MHDPLVMPTDAGLYGPAGDVHIDPWRPLVSAVMTHAQASREVLEDQLEIQRLRAVLERAAEQHMLLISLERFSPRAFPLWVERQRNRISTEGWRERVQRMMASLEKHAARQPKRRP